VFVYTSFFMYTSFLVLYCYSQCGLYTRTPDDDSDGVETCSGNKRLILSMQNHLY
jgi:hypothetical protein